MSKASTQARELLATATQGAWDVEEFEGRGAAIMVRHEPDDADEVVAHGYLTKRNADVIAAACSPAGGLLAKLAEEVEEGERLNAILALKRRQAGTGGPKQGVMLVDEIHRLRAALEAARVPVLAPWAPHEESCRLLTRVPPGACDCGMGSHNARIDAALKGTP